MARATLNYLTELPAPWAQAKAKPAPRQAQDAARRKRTRTDTAPMPQATDWAALADMLAGKGFRFEVAMLVVDDQGVVKPGVKTFYIRQPTTAEYDDAQMLYEQTDLVYRGSPLGQGLKGLPVEELQALADSITDPKQAKELRTMTADVYLARLDARLRRDRFLAVRLLCDENGPLFDGDTPEGIAAWDALPMAVKEAARPVIWRMLEVVNQLPFGWERLRKPASASASGSDSRPTT